MHNMADSETKRRATQVADKWTRIAALGGASLLALCAIPSSDSVVSFLRRNEGIVAISVVLGIMATHGAVRFFVLRRGRRERANSMLRT